MSPVSVVMCAIAVSSAAVVSVRSTDIGELSATQQERVRTFPASIAGTVMSESTMMCYGSVTVMVPWACHRSLCHVNCPARGK